MIPIEDLRRRVGLDPSDPSRDEALILADEVATAMLETWLDRKLQNAADVETFTHFDGSLVSLRRYPLTEGSVTVDGATGDVAFHVDAELGLVLFDRRLHEHQVTVAYEGGYLVLPPALYAVLMLVFDDVWRALSAGGQGQTGEIRSITIPDVGTMQYASGQYASGSGNGSLPGIDYGIPPQYASIVELYRRQHA